MNAGPGVERLIVDWLAEEAPGRAPDRILGAAGLVIDRTRQRRFVADWRNPMFFTLRGVAAAGVVIAVVVLGAAFAFRGGGPGGQPTQTPGPTPTASPTPQTPSTPRPFTGACTLVTRDEAASIAGDIGLGALPTEVGLGNETSCRYADGGGNIVLRITWTRVGGIAALDPVRNAPDIEVVADLGDEALYDLATHTLYVRSGDALVAITASEMGASAAERRQAAEGIGALVATRM